MAEAPQAPQLPEPNPVTTQAHQHQAFWQIKFPLLVGVILVLIAAAGVIVASVSGGGDVSRWSDISIIWLIAPMLLLTLILIAATAGMVYMMGRLLPVLPRYSHLLLGYFLNLSIQVKGLSNAATEPFLRLHSMSASVRAFRQSLRRKSG